MAGHRVVEEHHDSVARELVKRAFELADQRSKRAMVLAKEGQDFLGLGGLQGGAGRAQARQELCDGWRFVGAAPLGLTGKAVKVVEPRML